MCDVNCLKQDLQELPNRNCLLIKRGKCGHNNTIENAMSQQQGRTNAPRHHSEYALILQISNTLLPIYR